MSIVNLIKKRVNGKFRKIVDSLLNGRFKRFKNRIKAKILLSLIPDEDNLKLSIAKALLSRDYGNVDPIPFWDHVDMQGYRIMNLGTPVEANDAVTKAYVDERLPPTLVKDLVFGVHDTDYVIVNTTTPNLFAYQVTPYAGEIPFDPVVYYENPSGSGSQLWIKVTLYRADGLEDIIDDWFLVSEGVSSKKEYLVNRIFNVLSKGVKIKGIYVWAYYVGAYPSGYEPKVRLVTKTVEIST